MIALRKQWVLDIQRSDMKEELANEVRELWQEDDRLSNDVCISKFTKNDWHEADAGEYPYPKIYAHITTQVPYGEEVWIHWWW